MHRVFASMAAALTVAVVMTGSAAAAESAGATPKATATPKPVRVEQKASEQKAPEPKTHEVAAGDSLSSIAESEGLESWRPMWNANASLQDPNLIYAGQKLTVPQGATEDRPLPEAVAAPQPVAAVQSPVRPAPQRAAAANYAAGSPGIFERIRARESGGNYATNTGNGYYGAYQFSLGTWQGVGGTGLPSNASPAEQDMRAQMLYERRGCSPWPNTCY